MARMSISVPETLKEEMDAIGDKENWSGLAQSAFQSVVFSHKSRKNQDMEAVIERLRASKAQAIADDIAEGKQDGRNWAAHTASYREIKRTIKFLEENREHSPTVSQYCEEMELTLEEFFDGEPNLSEPYFEGWLAGVEELWKEVEDKL
ncbi:hypothetical protein [Methylovirgula sp. 4M-Z18]|uniref:hypothetical protein n=1 Tax=Methylovirgula sp. 4M-Z18 TaxID=2293567 RepID=UPI0011C0328F|nr:hypothetical protein [Methylovirgula sp. 4M-Z18]